MTWIRLQELVSALIIGDNVLSKRMEARIALLEYALHEIAQSSEVIALQVENDVSNMERQGVNGYNIRKSNLPESDEDILDIDPALVFVAARLMASYISKEKYEYHRSLALDMMKAYTDKVERFRRMSSINTIGGERTYMNTGETI